MDETHTMVPVGQGLSFLFLRGCFPYIITMPPQGKFVRFGVYQQVEQFWEQVRSGLKGKSLAYQHTHL